MKHPSIVYLSPSIFLCNMHSPHLLVSEGVGTVVHASISPLFRIVRARPRGVHGRHSLQMKMYIQMYTCMQTQVWV